MLKTRAAFLHEVKGAYHLGEGRVLKTSIITSYIPYIAYHLGEGRVLKTQSKALWAESSAYHLGEGRVLKTFSSLRLLFS